LLALLVFPAASEQVRFRVIQFSARSQPNLNQADVIGRRRDGRDLCIDGALDVGVLQEVVPESPAESLLCLLARLAMSEDSIRGLVSRRARGLLLSVAVLADRVDLRAPVGAGGGCLRRRSEYREGRNNPADDDDSSPPTGHTARLSDPRPTINPARRYPGAR